MAQEIPVHSSKALRACAEWLAYCLQIGWTRSQLSDLEGLWWKYHDERGKLIWPR